MFSLDRDHVYRSSLLENISWLRHGFGTRKTSGWLRVENLTAVRQFHSDLIVISKGTRGLIGEGDALITTHGGTLLSVRTADCLPILLTDVRQRAVGAVHAGWRGTVLGIAMNTVRAMEREYGSKPEDLRVAIGPGIGSCCFEVGPEVAAQFETLFPERDDLQTRVKLDLVEANVRQLIGAGVSFQHIDAARICTCCDGDLFHSFRKNREAAGRMTSVIGLQSE